MMRSSLFRRTFAGIMAAMLVIVTIFAGLVTAAMQRSRQNAYEREVYLQAREISEYMTQLNLLSSVRTNKTINYIIRAKMAEIQQTYHADIWIVAQTNGPTMSIQILDSNLNTSENVVSEPIMQQLEHVLSNEEIRVAGLFPELGEDIVTIGVPWTYTDGRVLGAVLLHIPNEDLTVSFDAIANIVLPCLMIAALLALVVSIFVARAQTKPLRELDDAVREFTKGDLTRRVDLHCGGELEALGNSINRMAMELSQLEDSRRNFVAAVSHELRSPMTCMRGYVEAMLDGTIPAEEVPDYLKVVLDETNRLTALVRDLLEMSRIEAGKIPLQIAPFDANELVRRILVNFEPRISAKGLSVEVDLAEDPCYALGDAARINQVISNFIDNAVKFLPENTGVLTVQTRQDGKNVRFAVRNNGPEIAEKDLPHIFERFYKADKAHTSGMGTGLGLSICRLIVREHKRDIEVQSNPEETVFSFALPVAQKTLQGE